MDNQKDNQKDYIIRSHQRCDAYNVEKDRVFSKKIITGEELAKRLAQKKELIDNAEPYMKQLYDFVQGSNFFSLLTDEEGCILSIFGDDKILAEALSYKMFPGSYMDERNIGTNSMGTVLAEGRPLQVSGEEHYIYAYHKWTCSASPIRNSKGEIIGTIDLTGYSENVNLHTLGMVVAAANAIEEMLDIKNYTEELALAKGFAEAIMDSIESGILTSDLEGNVVTVNRVVADMFGYAPDEMKRMKTWDLLEDWDRIKGVVVRDQNFSDEDLFVNSRKNKLQLNVSAYPHFDDKQNLMNIILVFKEVKRVRKLANKIMGHHAIYTFDKIIGKDPEFVKTIEYAKKIADSRSNVLITGESGTGKELFAQAIHNYSSRHEEPFVALNCGAIPRNLIESELFGYEGGAFTGSKSTGQIGKFQIADGGTIFLDEVGEMPLDMQTRLLRVIEEGTVRRIGSNKEVVVDVRVIAATNKDLRDEVNKGNFRKDLYYRLNVLPISLIPLRERRSDIPLLSMFFMERISKKLNKKAVVINEDAMKSLMDYEWPGNVRELENIIELMVNTEAVPESFLKMHGYAEVKDQSAQGIVDHVLPGQTVPEKLDLDFVERQHILKVLELSSGNISQCAKSLGIGRNTLYRKLETFGINCSETEQRSIMKH